MFSIEKEKNSESKDSRELNWIELNSWTYSSIVCH
jgi:hypothetical protein